MKNMNVDPSGALMGGNGVQWWSNVVIMCDWFYRHTSTTSTPTAYGYLLASDPNLRVRPSYFGATIVSQQFCMAYGEGKKQR